ncbi:fibroin heavy chain-like isoform X3 [Uranotaenia lowii]|uniref:fibroin heavy chain-like isoform X3 n=1 Tax=Uranotaenia lowii TaxID=190385 RepID=UPI00247998B5|nr:fibroin heavy chain-like isoform X3 [Uranotaenia lowii]
MLKFVLLSVLVAGASAGYASSQYAGTSSNGLYNQINAASYADKYPYTNTGFNGGFAQNFAGPNGVVGAAAGVGTGAGAFTPGFAPYQPVPAFPNAFDFNGFFQGLQNNFANLYQQQLNHQNALFNSFRQQQQAFAAAAGAQGAQGQQQHFAGGAPNGGQYGFAGSSASYGPGGFHQTAQIYPENPGSPNIDTRFGGSQQGGPGFVGVSSFSSSSNINGQTHREAATSVNDNGKVTTYHVRS